VTPDAVVAGRDLIPWRDLSRCFKASPRGLGITYRTIQAWKVARPEPMPYVQDGRRILFNWDAVWMWYKKHYGRGAES
jgi:hypothetical protein